MTAIQTQVVATLRGLLGLCRKNEAGFHTAAQRATDRHLQMLFQSYCQQSGQLATELEREIKRLGGAPQPQTGGKTWADEDGEQLSQFDGQPHDAGILAACQTATSATFEDYERALKIELPLSVKQILSRQKSALRATRERMQELIAEPIGAPKHSTSVDGG